MSRRVSFRGAVGEQKEPVVVRLGRAAAGGRALGRLAGPVLVGLLLMRTAVGQEPPAAEGPPAGEPPQPPAFVSLDRNGDGRLTLGELCGPRSDQAPEGPLLARTRRAFEQADRDGDGVLSREEYAASPAVAEAAQAEAWLAQNAWPKFRLVDRSGDGRLTLEEWLVGVPAEQQKERTRDFRLVDFDGSGNLSFTEFLALPQEVPRRYRGPVPDPVVESWQEQQEQLLRRADRDGDGAVSRSEWPAAELGRWLPVGPLTAFERWDADHDGRVRPEEWRSRLELLWGIRHGSGARLRRQTGEVFSLRAFTDRDRDRDGTVSLQEFTSFKSGTASRFHKARRQLDRDGDGRLSLPELSARPLLFWKDVLADFLKFDTDWDGYLSQAELDRQTPPWDRKFLDQVLPAFDTDQDGRLSFREYRVCPLANPLQNWRPKDVDGDGAIGFSEYHRGSDCYAALSWQFFRRLDRNGDGRLSSDEVAFDIDPNRAPLELVFQRRDRDGDGRWSLQEAAGPPPKDADSSSTARRRYEERLMRVEDAFRLADRDGDHHLTLKELKASEEAVALILPKRRRAGAAAAGPAPILPSDQSWDWRFIGLITFNVLLWIGVAGAVVWLVGRKT